MPARAFIGLEKFCREFAGLKKKQRNYDKADSIDLMIEREAGEETRPEDAQPELKLSVSLANAVLVDWKKAGFDALELQYRKAGEAMWQAADKSTEKTIEFTPPATTPGVPEKFEFRGVYLLKNQRVGQWSTTYTITLG